MPALATLIAPAIPTETIKNMKYSVTFLIDNHYKSSQKGRSNFVARRANTILVFISGEGAGIISDGKADLQMGANVEINCSLKRSRMCDCLGADCFEMFRKQSARYAILKK